MFLVLIKEKQRRKEMWARHSKFVSFVISRTLFKKRVHEELAKLAKKYLRKRGTKISDIDVINYPPLYCYIVLTSNCFIASLN